MYKLKDLPRFLKILGFNINIKQDTERLMESGAYGEYCPTDKCITLRGYYTNRNLAEWTLTHEICHAVFRSLAAQLDPHLEEVFCDNIARAITENFRLTPR